MKTLLQTGTRDGRATVDQNPAAVVYHGLPHHFPSHRTLTATRLFHGGRRFRPVWRKQHAEHARQMVDSNRLDNVLNFTELAVHDADGAAASLLAIA